MKLSANKAFKYASRHLTAGEVFEPKSKDARLLVAAGICKEYVEPVKIASLLRKPVVYEPVKSTNGDDHEEAQKEEEVVVKKRQYKRRDMQAE